MTIKERLIRRAPEDIIYIGDLVERHYADSEFGSVLEALTQGRITEELLREKNGMSAERILGRVEMASKLASDLEQFILDRDEMQKPIKRKRQQKETTIAEDVTIPEPETAQYGGQV